MFGEGAPDVKGSGNFNENSARPYTAEDIRFTTKGDTLYAFALAWPKDGNKLSIKTLAKKQVNKIELLGSDAPVTFEKQADALVVTLPDKKPNEYVVTLKIV